MGIAVLYPQFQIPVQNFDAVALIDDGPTHHLRHATVGLRAGGVQRPKSARRYGQSPIADLGWPHPPCVRRARRLVRGRRAGLRPPAPARSRARLRDRPADALLPPPHRRRLLAPARSVIWLTIVSGYTSLASRARSARNSRPLVPVDHSRQRVAARPVSRVGPVCRSSRRTQTRLDPGLPPADPIPRRCGRSSRARGHLSLRGPPDQTPSLHCYSDGKWFCFGCGAGGSIYDFASLQSRIAGSPDRR